MELTQTKIYWYTVVTLVTLVSLMTFAYALPCHLHVVNIWRTTTCWANLSLVEFSSSSWTTTDWSDLWDWQQWHFECGCWRQGHWKEWHLESTSYDLVFFQRFSIVIDCHERVCEGSEWDWCGRYTAAVWSMNMYVAALGTISWRTCLTVNIEMVKCCKWTKPQRERYYIRFHFTSFLTYGNNWGEDHHYQRQGSFDGRTDREDDQGGEEFADEDKKVKKGAVEKVTCHGLNLIHSVHYENKGQLTPRQGVLQSTAFILWIAVLTVQGPGLVRLPTTKTSHEWLSSGCHVMRVFVVSSRFACHECASNGGTAAGWMRRMPLMVTSIPCVLPQRAPATTRVWVKRWTRRRRLGTVTSKVALR